MPVFPTMHTFFMNADNLFRPDENIDQMEVVRGGSSALFGSNTPGAIINFINKTGGHELHGSLRASAATEGLARYDFNTNGPLGDDWRFNVGGFYRYDHGVRDPGLPRNPRRTGQGQRHPAPDNGYFRLSGKVIDDRNQFILDLPFTNPGDPTYVPGFGDYGAMNTIEGNHIRVPTPNGQLELPLDNGLRTRAGWITADAAFDLATAGACRTPARRCRMRRSGTRSCRATSMPAADFVTRPRRPGRSRISRRHPVHLHLHQPPRPHAGNPSPSAPPNGLVAPGGEWHIEKPLSAFQDQFQLRKSVRPADRLVRGCTSPTTRRPTTGTSPTS